MKKLTAKFALAAVAIQLLAFGVSAAPTGTHAAVPLAIPVATPHGQTNLLGQDVSVTLTSDPDAKCTAYTVDPGGGRGRPIRSSTGR